MPKATNDHSTSRRGLLGAGSAGLALAVLPAVAAASNPDAELIAACDAYIQAFQAYSAEQAPAELTLDEDDAYWDEAYARLAAFERRTENFTAKTVAGVVAEARVAMCIGQNPDGSDSFDGGQGSEWTERVMRSLLRVHGEPV